MSLRAGMIALALAAASLAATAAEWPQYDTNPFVIKLSQQPPGDDPAGRLHGAGGVTCADLDGDGLMDFLYTVPGSIGAYSHDGEPMWRLDQPIILTSQSEGQGLPGLHCPGVQVADIDGDGVAEVLFLTEDGVLHVVKAATGVLELSQKLPCADGVSAWQHVVVCNLRGEGDRDIVVQAAPDALDYKVGHVVWAFACENDAFTKLWEYDTFGALAHGPLRVADLNGDGRDEICGFTLLGPDGRPPDDWAYPSISDDIAGGASFHIDSIFLYDVRPDVPGLEAVLLEEGRNYIGLLNFDAGLLWHVHNERQEPQNAAVGEFDPDRPGLEIWCRSRYNEHQLPWVHDARGEIISRYAMDDVAPDGWTISGVEEIFTIDWTGGPKQLACAKERHTEGDVCVFDPISGEFLERIDESAARLYVADVSGDWREEIIVVNFDELHIYHNPAPNPQPDRPRLWEGQAYRRNKMTWNYYSP